MTRAEKILNMLEQKDVARGHQVRVARDTLKMSPAMVKVMGGMTREEAIQVLLDAGYSQEEIDRMSKEESLDSEIIGEQASCMNQDMGRCTAGCSDEGVEGDDYCPFSSRDYWQCNCWS